MAGDNNNSGEATERSANAASTISGAIKTGKAVSDLAKGAAAGPYGAAAALWKNRKTVGKIVLAAACLLLLPVLFILMLPSLIFGGLKNNNSTAGTDIPIMNNNAAIIENVNNISYSVNGIMVEALDDVTARINADFTSYGEGVYLEIVNPNDGNRNGLINLFVSQYCAAKDKDFESIVLSDMEGILRRNKSHLYSFTKQIEIRPSITVDPETEETIEIEEQRVVYTIVYNGESYFADNIFALSDEQKQLSKDYAMNMSMYFGDGVFQGLLPFEFIVGPSYEGIKFTDGMTTVVYYSQLDERFANEPYGTDNIGGFGCGPTSMAMVVSSLTSVTIDPIQMAIWSYNNGGWCSNSGSFHSLIPHAATEWGLPVEGCTASEPQRIVDALSSGKLVVALMTKGHFTSAGHFMVLRGVTSGGKILVADPASYSRSQKEWDLSIILNEASRSAGAGGPFWIIG